MLVRWLVTFPPIGVYSWLLAVLQAGPRMFQVRGTRHESSSHLAILISPMIAGFPLDDEDLAPSCSVCTNWPSMSEQATSSHAEERKGGHLNTDILIAHKEPTLKHHCSFTVSDFRWV